MSERLAVDAMILTNKKTVVKGWALGQVPEGDTFDVTKLRYDCLMIDYEQHPHLRSGEPFGGEHILVLWQPFDGYEPKNAADYMIREEERGKS